MSNDFTPPIGSPRSDSLKSEHENSLEHPDANSLEQSEANSPEQPEANSPELAVASPNRFTKPSIEEPLDPRLVDANGQALKEGADLIRLLQPGQYTQGFTPAFQSTIGAHFRHVLEHYRCFLSQLASGLFCYDKRARDQSLECDSDYALQTIEELITGLEQLGSEGYRGAFLIEDEQTSVPVNTSLNRELLFLQSHTVHHYAIIGAMTRAFGNRPDEDFGVAIATRVHNEKCAEKAMPLAKGATCAR